METHTGVRSHLGKLRAWSSGGGPALEDLAALGSDIWTADRPPEHNGIKVLGTPIGQAQYVTKFSEERVANEKHLLTELVKLEDPQCAWLMLSMSAAARPNHMIRMLPPSLSSHYAQLLDEKQASCTKITGHDSWPC